MNPNTSAAVKLSTVIRIKYRVLAVVQLKVEPVADLDDLQ